MAGAEELDEPRVVDDPVDHGRGELVVAQDGAPLGELDVGRDDQAAPLVAVRRHLEQHPRAGHVDRHVSELVQYHQVGARGVPQDPIERSLALGALQAHHEVGRGVEPHRPAFGHRLDPYGGRQVRLAPAGLSVEREPLRRIEEPRRLQVLGAVALREGRLGEVVALERLDLGEARPVRQPLPLVARAALELLGERLIFEINETL